MNNLDMSQLMPGSQADPSISSPVDPSTLMQTLKANLMAQNSQPTNAMTNPELPQTIEDALMVIEDQKRIIQALKAQVNSSSSKRDMNA